MEPHPPYESVAPSTHPVYTGNDSLVLPFVPFADEAAFPHEKLTAYLGYFKGSDWKAQPALILDRK